MAALEASPVGLLAGNNVGDFDWFFSQFDSDDSAVQSDSPVPSTGLSKPCRATAGKTEPRPQVFVAHSPEPPDWRQDDTSWLSPPDLLPSVAEDVVGSQPPLDFAGMETQFDILDDLQADGGVFGDDDLVGSLMEGEFGLQNGQEMTGKQGQQLLEGFLDSSTDLWQDGSGGSGSFPSRPLIVDAAGGLLVPTGAERTLLHNSSTSGSSGTEGFFSPTASAGTASQELPSRSSQGAASPPRSSNSACSILYPTSESTGSWCLDPDFIPESGLKIEPWDNSLMDLREPSGNMAGPLVVRPTQQVTLSSSRSRELRHKGSVCHESCSCPDCEHSSWSGHDFRLVGAEEMFPTLASMGSGIPDTRESKQLPIIVHATGPSRPADMSDRLAALVGPLSKDEVAKTTAAPGLSVIGDALNTATIRPPSSKARAPRMSKSNSTRTTVSRSRSTATKVDVGKLSMGGTHVDTPLGIRKPGKVGTQLLPAVAEALVVDPRVDMSLSKAVVLRNASSSDGQLVGDILKQQLVALAEAIATDDQARVRFLTGVLGEDANPQGTPSQRMAYRYMAALAAKAGGTGSQMYTAPLKTNAQEMAKMMQTCSQKMPFMDFCNTACNAAIIEEVFGESRVHIVDIGLWQGVQLLKLMQQLAVQPGGPPHLRITGVQSPWLGNVFKKAMTANAAAIGRELAKVAAELRIPFEFHVVESRMENLKPFMIRQEPGEALIAISSMRLQHLWDQSVVRSSPRDATLQFVRQLAPRMFVIMEVDADLNGAFFMERFRESVDFFTTHFEAQEAIFAGHHQQNRTPFEAEYLGREIVNVVACEGLQRVVRPERLEKWHSRLSRLGFSGTPMDPRVLTCVERMLRRHSKYFAMLEHPSGGIRLMWKDRPMVFTGIWRPLF